MRNCYYFFVVVFTEVLIKWRTLTGGFTVHTKAVAQRHSVKKVFLEISQNLQENTCAKAFSLINLQAGLRPATLLKKRLWHRCFPVNFAKPLTTRFLTEQLRWQPLDILTFCPVSCPLSN